MTVVLPPPPAESAPGQDVPSTGAPPPVRDAGARLAPPASPLPLPPPGWGVVHALAALEAARVDLPVPLAPAEPVSALTTVVLRCGQWAVKVYPPGTDADHLAAHANALAGSTTALLPVCRPVTTAYGVITVTEWVPPGPDVRWSELGDLLRRFHIEHQGAVVPAWRPLSRVPEVVEGLSAVHAQVLLDARESLLAALAEVRSELGAGVIHGDFSPGNVLRRDGAPRLIDLDWLAAGPLEYDLLAAERRLRRGEISRRQYRQFCAGYGWDVRGWPGTPVLDAIADLGGVAFRIWDDRHHGRPLDWLPGELPRWRTPF
jgi:hypothetical protein